MSKIGEGAVVTDRRGWWAAVSLLAGTVGQLLVATLVPGLPQFEGKAFAGRLLAYPVLMLLVPALWALQRRRRAGRDPPS